MTYSIFGFWEYQLIKNPWTERRRYLNILIHTKSSAFLLAALQSPSLELSLAVRVATPGSWIPGPWQGCSRQKAPARAPTPRKTSLDTPGKSRRDWKRIHGHVVKWKQSKSKKTNIDSMLVGILKERKYTNYCNLLRLRE